MSSRAAQFQKLYERHNRLVLAYCLRRISNAEAYDAASEVFAVAWRRLDDIPDDKELAWLYGVARRVLSRKRRSANRFSRLVKQVQMQPQPTTIDVADEVLGDDRVSQVRAAIGMLKARDQEILRLAAWEGLSHRDIAEVLDISTSAVDQRLHRAKQRLAVAYEGLFSPGDSAIQGSSA